LLNSQFGPKLDLVLKSLSMSRGRLAAELKVDKSAVGRWGGGTVVPSAHNLTALTSFIASRRSGFTMLDWDRDLASFAQVLGIDPAALRRDLHQANSGTDSIFFPQSLIDVARRETQRRGKFYEGFYEATFASTVRPGSFNKEMAMIRRRAGLLYMRMGSTTFEASGWLFLIANQLFGVLGNAPDDSFVFLILNGLPIRHVDTMDGLMVDNSGDVSLAPHATPIYFEFLEGLRENDEARFAALKAASGYLEPSALRDELRRHLLPDVGPAAAAAGIGDLHLRLLTSRSLSRGTDFRD
jgi:hypothetical protein